MSSIPLVRSLSSFSFFSLSPLHYLSCAFLSLLGSLILMKWTSFTQLEKFANKHFQAYCFNISEKYEKRVLPLLLKYQSWGKTLADQAHVTCSSKEAGDRTAVTIINSTKITVIGAILQRKSWVLTL